MNKNQPLVSVIIAVYNDKRFFPFSIESILKQTYKNFEILIVDDCSDEDTRKMLEKYRDKNPKTIKYIRLKKNLGDGERARNMAVPFAKGKYIAILDSDDIAYANRLAKQVNFLEKNEGIFLVGSSADIIDENGTIIGERKQPTDCDLIKKSMYRKNAIINPSVMFRNEHKNKFYKIRFPFFNDYYTFCYLLSKGNKIYNLPEKLIKYRINRSGATFSNIKYKFSVNMMIKKRIIQKYGYTPSLIDKIVVNIESLMINVIPESFLFKIYSFLPNK